MHYLQFSSDNFVLAAGGVLFRLAPSSSSVGTDDGSDIAATSKLTTTSSDAASENIQTTPSTTHTTPQSPQQAHPSDMTRLQVCVLHHKPTNDFLLPKGRKDVNETLEKAAIRETYEETGYNCEPLPCPMFTRAPNPEVYTGLQAHVEPSCTEPFTVTLKMQKDGSAKLIFWYLLRVVSNSAPKVTGTQMLNESFESEFMDANVAIEKMTKPDYTQALKLAVELVQSGMTMTSHRPAFNP